MAMAGSEEILTVAGRRRIPLGGAAFRGSICRSAGEEAPACCRQIAETCLSCYVIMPAIFRLELRVNIFDLQRAIHNNNILYD